MALFKPNTTIYLCKDTGLMPDHKAYFATNSAMISYMSSHVYKSFTNCSYQRADDRNYTQLPIDFYDALQCDALYWQNPNHSSKYLIALITGVEYLNENTTRVYFEVDAYSSFCGDIEWQACFVEREHADEDWTDGQPNWNNIGIPEQVSGSPSVVCNELTYPLTPTKYIVLSPYDASGDLQFGATIQDHVFQGLNQYAFDSADEVNSYLNAVALNGTLDNIAGVLSVPAYFLSDEEWEMGTLQCPWIIFDGHYNNSKVYSSQYCVLRVEGVAGKVRTYLPELTGVDGLATPLTQLYAKGNMVGGIGGLGVYLAHYKGIDKDLEDAFIISDLPQGTWVANNLINNGIKTALTVVAQGAGMVTGIISGNVAGTVAAGAGLSGTLADYIKNAISVEGQSNATANLACAMDAYRVATRWYVSPTSVMEAIDDYFDRFGYAVMRLKIPNVNTRPCWNYVKTVEAHIGGDIPEFYRNQICEMLNKGVTFWHTGNRSIGNFSNANANQPMNYTYDDYEETPPSPPEVDTETDPDIPLVTSFSLTPDEVNTYSLASDGETYLAQNFKVKEFACNDGSDTILISARLVELLQLVRSHYGVAVTINSGYRTASYNSTVNGAAKSQHIYGRAADIVVKGVTPLEVYNYINTSILPSSGGGLGCYRTKGFVHVDVRPTGYWRNNNV